ncbi:MAG: hypothetical protein IH851_09910 [Armatimonadetes bacterium]|nr:hypothetical protein [Armatimonadota bacterium]
MNLEVLRRADRRLALLIVILLSLGILYLAVDRPPPSPDFYVFAQIADDIYAGERTGEKLPPGLPILLAPFSPAGAPTQYTVALVVGLISYVGLGAALIGISGRLRIIGAVLIVSAVLANRYSIMAALSGTAHLPFWAASAGCLWATLSRRWYLAYTLAATAFLLRYNGAVLPVLVASWHLFDRVEPPMRWAPVLRKIGVAALLVLICMSPVGAWLKYGTSAGVASYSAEVEARGKAGLQAVKYLPATVAVPFIDSSASASVTAGRTTAGAVFALGMAGLAALGVWGLGHLWRGHKGVLWWTGASLAWWVWVHSGFPEVGGLYLYAMQLAWLLWIFVGAGVCVLLERNSPWLLLLGLPVGVMALNGSLAQLLALGLGVPVLALAYLARRDVGKLTLLPLLAACVAVGVGAVAAKEKVYDRNYGRLVRPLQAWAAVHHKVLVSPMLLDILTGEDLDTSDLVSEEFVDGADVRGSLTSLGVRYVAVCNWEVEDRDRAQFWKGHEFFLGSRYRGMLRPYELLVDAYEQKGWTLVHRLHTRGVAILLFEPD